jgi:hypothetical protein
MNDLGSRHQEDPLRSPGDAETVALLQSERPVPSPTFRGDLRRRLVSSRDTGTAFGLRLSIPAQIGGCLGLGLALFAVTAVGLVGAGPFAS